MLRTQVVFGYGFLILEAEKDLIQQQLKIYDDSLVSHIKHTMRNVEPRPILYKLDYSDPMFLCLYTVVDDQITAKADDSYYRRITRDEMTAVEDSMSEVAREIASLFNLDITQVGWYGFQGS